MNGIIQRQMSLRDVGQGVRSEVTGGRRLRTNSPVGGNEVAALKLQAPLSAAWPTDVQVHEAGRPFAMGSVTVLHVMCRFILQPGTQHAANVLFWHDRRLPRPAEVGLDCEAH